MNILVEINATYYYMTANPELTYTHLENTTYYAPRVLNYPTISRSVGSAYYGVNNIDSISIELNNKDGFFDSLYSSFFHKSVVIRAGDGNTLSGYRVIFTGKISDAGKSMDTISLTISDAKESLNKNMVFTYYSTATYANLNPDNAGKPIPQMWGQNIKMPCVCTNEMESPPPTNYTFKICDTSHNVLTSIDAVYLNDVVVTYANTNLTNGTFTIAAATLGTDNFGNVTASATNAKTNPVNIIQDIIDTAVSGYVWHTSSMTTTAAQGFITSYYQADIVDVLTAINAIMNDTNLILITSSTGVSSLKYFTSDRTVTRRIQNHEYTDEFTVSNNINEFASSIVITYLPSRSTDSKKYHRVATYATEAAAWYGDTKEIQLDTNLTNTTDAELKANKILELSSIFRETFTRSIRLDIDENIELFDFMAAEPGCRDVNIDNETYSTYEILGIVDNYELLTRQLTLRYIKPYNFVNVFDILIDENFEEIVDENLETFIMGDYAA